MLGWQRHLRPGPCLQVASSLVGGNSHTRPSCGSSQVPRQTEEVEEVPKHAHSLYPGCGIVKGFWKIPWWFSWLLKGARVFLRDTGAGGHAFSCGSVVSVVDRSRTVMANQQFYVQREVLEYSRKVLSGCRERNRSGAFLRLDTASEACGPWAYRW